MHRKQKNVLFRDMCHIVGQSVLYLRELSDTEPPNPCVKFVSRIVKVSKDSKLVKNDKLIYQYNWYFRFAVNIALRGRNFDCQRYFPKRKRICFALVERRSGRDGYFILGCANLRSYLNNFCVIK